MSTANVDDPGYQSHYCPECGALLAYGKENSGENQEYTVSLGISYMFR